LLHLREINKLQKFEPYIRDISPKKGIKFTGHNREKSDGGQIEGVTRSVFIQSPKEFHSTHFKSFFIDSSHLLSTSQAMRDQTPIDETFTPPLDASVFNSTTMKSLNPNVMKRSKDKI
jgi:hypothetical protein